MANRFPLDYTNKGSADATDKIWASDGITNFNITVGEVGDRNFSDKSTTNLSEGTNLYYTEARVSANSTVIGKADKTNVLELNNTTPFTPDADYEPATKKYVDDNDVNINGKTAKTTPVNADEYVIYDSVGLVNKKITHGNVKAEINASSASSVVAGPANIEFTDTTLHTGTETITVGKNITRASFILFLWNDDFNSPTWNHVNQIGRYTFNVSSSGISYYKEGGTMSPLGANDAPGNATNFTYSSTQVVNINTKTISTTPIIATNGGFEAKITAVYTDGSDLKIDWSLQANSGPTSQSTGLKIGQIEIN